MIFSWLPAPWGLVVESLQATHLSIHVSATLAIPRHRAMLPARFQVFNHQTSDSTSLTTKK
jgi:hypothetical protein